MKNPKDHPPTNGGLRFLVEKNIRQTIVGIPELKQLPEAIYCEVVLKALEPIRIGLEQRLDNLNGVKDEERKK